MTSFLIKLCSPGTSAVPPFSNAYSVLFDGVNETYSAGHIANVNFVAASPFSLAAWCKVTSDTQNGAIMSQKETGGGVLGWLFDKESNTGVVRFILYGNAGDITHRLHVKTTSQYLLIANGWQHVCVTYSGNGAASGVTFYINGVAVAKTTVVDILDGNMTTTVAPFRIGATDETASAFWRGNLDELSVWNKELSAAEVLALYGDDDVDSHSATADALHWYRMGDDAGDSNTTLVDQIGSATMTGANLEAGDVVADVHA